MVESETWEDKIRNIGQEIIDNVPLIKTEMSAWMDLSLSHTEERMTKKHSYRISDVVSQKYKGYLDWLIGRGIVAADCRRDDS